jgi:hypothetical protein
MKFKPSRRPVKPFSEMSQRARNEAHNRINDFHNVGDRPQPLYHVAPARERKASVLPTEHQEQVSVIAWWDRIYAPAHKLDYRLLFAIPNGGERNVVAGAKLKAEGMRRGAPDLLLAIPKYEALATTTYGLYIEMKRQDGYADKEQKDYHAVLRVEGYRVEVCRGSAAAIKVIEEYLGN